MATTTPTKRSSPRNGKRRREAPARRAEGEVVERRWKHGLGFALRFRAYGKRRYLTLGSQHEGWDPDKADEELRNILADVRRGLWVPPKKPKGQRGEEESGEPGELPVFGPFVSDIVAARKGQVSESSTAAEEWALGHLLPYFGDWPLIEIDVEAVDGYRLHKVRESEDRARAIERARPMRNEHGQVLRPLAPSTINKTIRYLRGYLAIAEEYGHVARNAAAGRRRLLREEKRPPVYLDTAIHVEALLEAAAELDRDPRFRCTEREAIVATLIFAGPRAHELGWMLERDIELASGRLFIGRSKTQAGLREIAIQPILRDVLGPHKAGPGAGGPDDFAFPTETGGRRDKNSLAKLLASVFERAEALLYERGQQPLPRGLSSHKLRHTFASILVALGEDPVSLMTQLGHTDAAFTLRVYTHLMRRSPEERARLKALARGNRVVAVEAPRPQALGSAAYERAIVRALAERGGRASRRQIMAAVSGAIGERHTEADRERLPGGEVRWKTRFGKARATLVKRGWLAAGSLRGEMELTDLGRAQARWDDREADRDRGALEPIGDRELEAVA